MVILKSVPVFENSVRLSMFCKFMDWIRFCLRSCGLLYHTTPESWSSDWGGGSSLAYNAWELVEWLRWRFFFTIQSLRVGRVTEVEVLLYHTTPENWSSDWGGGSSLPCNVRVDRVTEVEVLLYHTTPESWSSDWGEGWHWWVRLSRFPPRCSIGLMFKSGYKDSHGNTLMLVHFKNWLVAMVHVVLRCTGVHC
jgi:hypothetical protein